MTVSTVSLTSKSCKGDEIVIVASSDVQGPAELVRAGSLQQFCGNEELITHHEYAASKTDENLDKDLDRLAGGGCGEIQWAGGGCGPIKLAGAEDTHRENILQ